MAVPGETPEPVSYTHLDVYKRQLYCIHEHFPGKLMRMVCLGLNHRTAPVEIRERFAVPSHKLREEGQRIRSLPGVDQCVVLSTCNRMEIYYWSNEPENAQELILSHFLGDGRGELDMASYFYSHQGEDALGHLCRVLSGLDSMVLGETEIFGQVKTAYHTALDAGITAACANKTFQKAFTIGKDVYKRQPLDCPVFFLAPRRRGPRAAGSSIRAQQTSSVFMMRENPGYAG